MKTRSHGSPAGGPCSAGGRRPALTSSSLRDPVLSCPEALHCAQLGAAQYRMRRGGSRQEVRKHCGPRAALTNRLVAINPQGLALGSAASQLRLSAFCKKQGCCLRSPAARSADSGLPEVPQHLGKKRMADPVIG